jgi:hypothetical protein
LAKTKVVKESNGETAEVAEIQSKRKVGAEAPDAKFSQGNVPVLVRADVARPKV